VRDHAIADAAAGEALRLRAAENAEDIILRAGQTKGLEELLGLEAEGIGGFLEGDEDPGFQGLGRM